MTDTQVAKQQVTIKDYITAPAVQKKMASMFSEPRLLDGFTQSVIALAGSDDLLSKADPRSVFNAALQAASLNLSINKNLGYAHIIGFENRKKGIVEAQFQIGALGLKQLAQRTGQYKFLNDTDVREGELKKRDRMTGAIEFDWIEDDAERAAKPVIGYLCYFELKSGFSSTLFMTVDQLKEHGKKYSQTYKRGFGPWVDNPDAMYRKTVIKLNIKRNGPMSTELQRAVELDQAVVADDGTPEYIDGEVLDGEVLDGETKEEVTRKRIQAAEAKRKELDSAEHKAKAVKPSSPAPAENDTEVTPVPAGLVADVADVDVEAIKDGSLLDNAEVEDGSK
jgi:recombination protein RecT